MKLPDWFEPVLADAEAYLESLPEAAQPSWYKAYMRGEDMTPTPPRPMRETLQGWIYE